MPHIDVCRRLVEDSKGEYPIIAFVFGPLGTLSMLRNQEQMYMDCIEDPDMVKEAASKINETLIEYAEALLGTGIQGIMIDTLFSSGSIMRKEMWDDLEGDLVEKFAERVRAKNGLLMIHNCGEKIYFDAQMSSLKKSAERIWRLWQQAEDMSLLQDASIRPIHLWTAAPVCVSWLKHMEFTASKRL